MKGYTNAAIAALVAGAVAQVQYAPMPTRPAVLAKREPTCVMDSCQEAVDATDFCTCIRQGAEDCSLFLHDTVTLDVSTVYSTEVSVYTTSITESVTLTTLSDATETITAEELTTVTTGTETITLPVTSTPVVGKRSAGPAKKLRKRRSKQMPYYAKAACAAESAYESACACRGVYRSTVSVERAPTTITVISASYSPTETISETVSTETGTTTVATETVTSTTTESAVATALGRGPFGIQVLSVAENTGYNPTGKYGRVQYVTDSGGRLMSRLELNGDEASVWYYLDSDGYLKPADWAAPSPDYFFAVSPNDPAESQLQAYALGSITDLGYLRVRCSVDDATNELSCSVPQNSTKNTFQSCIYGAYTYLGFATPDTMYCTTMVLVVVPPILT